MPALESLPVRGAWRVAPEPRGDERGWFARYFCSAEAEQYGMDTQFVQFNHSYTRERGTVRGLHLQIRTGVEAKLVRCIRGAVLDVLLDLRRGSPTFLQYAAVELSADNRVAAYVPPGVAHGFQTLEADAELLYHHSNFYMPETERGVRFDDPRGAIAWPLPVADVSPKDRQWPLLSPDFTGFEIGGSKERDHGGQAATM